MPVFDAPINTDDRNLQRVLSQNLPIILYLYNQLNPALDEAFNRIARENQGKILVTRVNASQNPQTYAQYHRPNLPAVLTIRGGQVESKASRIQPSDVIAHVNFILGQGPKPAEPVEPHNGVGAGDIMTVSDASFARDVLQSPVPVLVDFWAPWCGPCHMIAPSVERVAQKYAGRLKVAKLNVDDNPQVVSRYQTLSIPTLIVFKGGQPAGRVVGAVPQNQIERIVEEALQK